MKKHLSIILSPVFILLVSLNGLAQPLFTGGRSQTLTVCQNSSTISIDYLLPVSDANIGTTDTWSVIGTPTHGIISASYFTTSTGGILTPTGTIYGPSAGYIGTDSFTVQVTDGTKSDTTTVYITVNPLPDAGAITGPSQVCEGATITLTDAATGGTWSTANTNASVAGGVVTALSAGLDTVSYTVTNSCGTAVASATITVNASPAPITGTRILCSGQSSPFSDAVGGGTWTSSSTTIVTIGSTSGIATGGFTGIVNIFYSLTGGCTAITTATVHVVPAAISGPATVCKGAQIVLLDGSPFGSWSSSDVTVGSVPPTVGLVTGVNAGTVTISYTVLGCAATHAVTVYPTSPITGTGSICMGTSTLLSDSLGVGTWSSPGYGSIISVMPFSGIVTGIGAGTAKITYTLTSTGCAVTATETVLLSPSAITGGYNACLGATTLLTDAVTGGSWMSDNTSIALIGSGTGVVTGLGLGTAGITYTVSDGCIASQAVTVNPLPVAYTVTGGGPYCVGDTGVHIFLSGSVTGVNYFLHIGGSVAGTLSGTGSGLDFGPETSVGAYTISATNTTTGCKSLMTATATVTTIPVVVPSVSLSVSTGDTICGGTISTFNATPVHGGTLPYYVWEVNGSLVGIDTPFYSFGPANGDIVTVTIASNEMCAKPDTVSDTVIMSVSPHETPGVTLTITPGDTICYGNVMTITPVPFYGGPAPAYAYFKAGVPVGAGHHYSFKPLPGDTVYCYMISDYFCRLSDTAIASVGVTIDTPILPAFTIIASPPALTAPGVSDTLTAVLTDPFGSFRYQWIVNDSIIHGATNSSYISTGFNYLGNDSVTCIVSRLGVCQLTTFNWTFMVNNVGVRLVNNAEINVSVIPNPNKGEFVIKGTMGTATDQQVSLELTDMLGRQVYKNVALAIGGNLNERIQLNSIANGMYLLNVRSEGANKVFHVVVEQ